MRLLRSILYLGLCSLSWGNLVADVKDRVGHRGLRLELEASMRDPTVSVFSNHVVSKAAIMDETVQEVSMKCEKSGLRTKL